MNITPKEPFIYSVDNASWQNIHTVRIDIKFGEVIGLFSFSSLGFKTSLRSR